MQKQQAKLVSRGEYSWNNSLKCLPVMRVQGLLMRALQNGSLTCMHSVPISTRAGWRRVRQHIQDRFFKPRSADSHSPLPLKKHIWKNRSVLATDQRTRTCWGTEGSDYENVLYLTADPPAISVAPQAANPPFLLCLAPTVHTNVHKPCMAR